MDAKQQGNELRNKGTFVIHDSSRYPESEKRTAFVRPCVLQKLKRVVEIASTKTLLEHSVYKLFILFCKMTRWEFKHHPTALSYHVACMFSKISPIRRQNILLDSANLCKIGIFRKRETTSDIPPLQNNTCKADPQTARKICPFFDRILYTLSTFFGRILCISAE